MKTSWKKRLIRFLAQVLVVTFLLMGIKIFMEGMYLLGIPQPEEVTQVTLSWPQLSPGEKLVTDSQQIQLAVYLTAYLKYVPFAKAEPGAEPEVTITYCQADGEQVTLAASQDTVWYKGKAHPLRHPGQFIKIAQGIFFMKETMES